ncbi:MAG TPA: Spy/CpxP family protein refolding chaperone [Pseudolabrys sp.]|nr:Spy/CpxP family protein refolding chaperone [Pseudolabrys sp.]
MLKSILAGTTALAIAGATLAYAAQPGRQHDHMNRWRPTAADITAFGDARIAALHAGLKLTPDQEKNWPAVESALRDLAKQRSERVAARASADKPKGPIERLARRATAMSERGTALKKVADAAEPLYQTLDEGQKHRFMILARLGGHRFGQWRHHRGHDGFRHQGPRGPERGPQPQ